MSNILFGDAKATARAADATQKHRELAQARARFEENPTRETQTVLATALFDVGRFEEAERLLRDIIATYGEDIQTLYDLAFTLKNLKQQDEMRKAFMRVVELGPRHPLARSAEHELWMMDPAFVPSWMRR